jgi:hypothetical protein
MKFPGASFSNPQLGMVILAKGTQLRHSILPLKMQPRQAIPLAPNTEQGWHCTKNPNHPKMRLSTLNCDWF